jgi:hypothetical protein
MRLPRQYIDCFLWVGAEKKPNPSLIIKGGTTKEETKVLTLNYGHGSQQGSMPGVTVLAGCRQ